MASVKALESLSQDVQLSQATLASQAVEHAVLHRVPGPWKVQKLATHRMASGERAVLAEVPENGLDPTGNSEKGIWLIPQGRRDQLVLWGSSRPSLVPQVKLSSFHSGTKTNEKTTRQRETVF